jgi:hypothetical protein
MNPSHASFIVGTHMANVFISYRKPDRDHAERLARELEAAGHQVWFDDWRIDVGDSIVERINEGLRGSTHLIVCFSASGDSPWMSREWMSALALQLSGQGGKVLPALLAGGAPPAILADMKFANLAKDWRHGVSELLRALR